MTTQYSHAQLERVRRTCLYIATKLGDLLDDVVIVGGLVPSLIVNQRRLPPGAERHLGTLDLDLGLALALLDNERYRTLSQRLRDAGFSCDVNEEKNETWQRWQVKAARGDKVTVDFLIPPSRPTDRAGTLHHLEPNFAAFIIPGLRLAFADRQVVHLSGKTIFGERAARGVWVSGPGAFVALKALAFDARGLSKDAYDLFYVVRNYGRGIEDVAERLRLVLREPEAAKVTKILKSDFLDPRGLGPMRVAEFQGQPHNRQVQADVAGFVRRLLDIL